MEDSLLQNVLSLYQSLIEHISLLEKKINEHQETILKLATEIEQLNKDLDSLIISAFVNRDLQAHRLSHEKRDKKWKFW